MYFNASITESERKNIHANVVSPKVIRIWKNSFKFGSKEFSPAISKLFLLVLKIIEGIINNALSPPQIMKVQLAPCQNPETRKMMKVLRTLIQLPPLLPPNGIYR